MKAPPADLSFGGEHTESTGLLDGKRTAPAQFPGSEQRDSGLSTETFLGALRYPSPAALPQTVNKWGEGGGSLLAFIRARCQGDELLLLPGVN